MTAPLLALCLLFAGAPAALPENPVERVCAKALRGDFGALAGWQKEGYQALAKGHRTHRAYYTHFGPYEGRQGRVDAYEQPCTMRTLASNKLPRRSWVLLQAPYWELRQVLDCGAKSNDRNFAYKHDREVWVDRWHPSPKLKDVGGPVTIAVSRER